MASNEITTPESVPPREGEDTNTIASTTALVGVAGVTDTTPNEDTSKPQNVHPSPSPNPDSQPPISPEDSPNEKEVPTPESTSTDAQAPTPQLNVQVPQTPQTYITFLFLSGRRRLMNFEPNTTIGRVKELVWAAWTAAPNDTQQPGQEIEERPPAPSYLRVLHLGRMLQDDETLRDLKLPTHLPTSVSSPDTPGGTPHGHAPISTIMHLSIRPFPPPGEADTGKKAGRAFGRGSDRTSNSGAPDPGDNANTGCCGCIIC
ncbi:hypothetical protein NMY22_g13539 [Coprinellus aureogranulatus]|nr:hypothetical protein NMY22_g13539 [Coprinellus aureogranulatus]